MPISFAKPNVHHLFSLVNLSGQGVGGKVPGTQEWKRKSFIIQQKESSGTFSHPHVHTALVVCDPSYLEQQTLRARVVHYA